MIMIVMMMTSMFSSWDDEFLLDIWVYHVNNFGSNDLHISAYYYVAIYRL
jgi:hypothetical protein